MNHVMVDLETMGTLPGCAVASIGAVEFEPRTGKIGASFYLAIDLASCGALGLSCEVDTVKWWLGQTAEARAALADNPVPCIDALKAVRAALEPGMACTAFLVPRGRLRRADPARGLRRGEDPGALEILGRSRHADDL